MKILHNFGIWAVMALAVPVLSVSTGCVFEDTPDKVDAEIKVPDADVEVTPAKPDTDVDVKVDR